MSRRPYECFKCRDSGFPNTMVYLAGKDDQGKTIQLEEDGTKHVHKGRTDVSTTVSDSRNAQESRSDNGQRTVIFTQENLDRIGSVYGQEDIEIEIEGRKPSQGQYASTHCGSVGSVGGNAYSDEDKGNVENKSPNDENYNNPGIEVKKDAALQESTDTPLHPLESVLSVLPHSASNDVPQPDQGQKKEHLSSQASETPASKAAEAAEANQAGEGVMMFGQDNKPSED